MMTLTPNESNMHKKDRQVAEILGGNLTNLDIPNVLLDRKNGGDGGKCVKESLVLGWFY